MSGSSQLSLLGDPEPESKASRIRRRVLAAALAIEQEAAADSGDLAFWAWIFVNCGLPHGPVPGSSWIRDNGAVRLCVLADPGIGIPHGRSARLILCWVTTRAKQTGERRVELGRSVSEFLKRLDAGGVTGGDRGTLRYLRKQLRRLFTATVSATVDFKDAEGDFWQNTGFRLTDDHFDCWSKHPDQESLWSSHVDLSERFFLMATKEAVPVDLRALRVLRSPLAMDLLVFLSWRCLKLRKKVEIPWDLLVLQFGANYASVHEFRRNAIRHLPTVLALYRALRVEIGDSGLILKPCDPHVPRLYTGGVEK